MASKGQKFMKLSSKTKKELLKINYQSRLWLKQFRAVKSADDVNYRQLKSYKKDPRIASWVYLQYFADLFSRV